MTVGEWLDWLNMGTIFDRACHAVGFFVIISFIAALAFFVVVCLWLGAIDLMTGFRR